eukprot:6340995-Ditylum_brightwellii.AAC.2
MHLMLQLKLEQPGAQKKSTVRHMVKQQERDTLTRIAGSKRRGIRQRLHSTIECREVMTGWDRHTM